MKANRLIKYPPFYIVFIVGVLIAGVSFFELYAQEVSAKHLVGCGTK